MRDGREMPKRIANAPELRLGLEIYYAAFMDLCTSRTGMGDGPISWAVVNEYAKAYDFDEEQRDLLHHYVSALDTEYLKFVNKKTTATDKGNKPKAVGTKT